MKLVIFDCDGTLVDSQNIIYSAMSKAFEDTGLPIPSRATVRSVIGLSLVEAVGLCMPDDCSADPQALAEIYKNAFADLRNDPQNDEPLFPGMIETLQHLSEQPETIMAVATGKSQRGMQRIIKRENLGNLFHSVQTADEHPSKPHPSMIVEAMTKAGIEADRTIMVGDTTFDMQMAVNARARAIGVSWGYHETGALAQSGAATIIDTFQDLPTAIDALLTTRAA
ncbi:MAG: HAD-IA family hydrolase [Hyphomicrobiaceae bacterium]